MYDNARTTTYTGFEFQERIERQELSLDFNTKSQQIPTSNTQVYYRSKIFSAIANDNPLLGAASALFALISRLKSNKNFSNAILLHNNLAHEILAFETQAKNKGYAIDSIRVARYALCATIDEILSTALWDEENIWEQECLLPRFEGDATGDERFFLILDKLIQNPARHIHLLELMYICLGLGFEGKYRNSVEGKKELDLYVDKLFHIIVQQRGETTLDLYVQNDSPALIQTSTHHHRVNFKALFLLVSFILGTTYIGFDYLVSARTAPIENKLHEITRNIEPVAP